MGCKVKVNRHGYLALRIFFNGIRSWEGTGLTDTAENRRLLEAAALVIASEIKNGTFDYLKHFPKGNKAHLFGRREHTSPSYLTVEAYYKAWIKRLTEGDYKRVHRLKDYQTIARHILKARVGGRVFGKIPFGFLSIADLKQLQSKIKAMGFKANTVNGYIHSCLRAMIRDARVDGLVTVDLYDKALFPPLPLVDVENSIDPYTPAERELILEAFRTKRPHYYPVCVFSVLDRLAAIGGCGA